MVISAFQNSQISDFENVILCFVVDIGTMLAKLQVFKSSETQNSKMLNSKNRYAYLPKKHNFRLSDMKN